MDMYWGFAAAEKEEEKNRGKALLLWFTTDFVLLTKNKIVYMCSTVSVSVNSFFPPVLNGTLLYFLQE